MLADKNLCHPPKWMENNIMFECRMGSMAYGCNTEESDTDLYGFCIPPKDQVFHIGEIPGFGTQKKRFEQYQEVHVNDSNANAGKGEEYDVSCYSIVRFIQLCMEGNPNMVDAIFVPRECISHTTQVGEMVRDNRKLFLSKRVKFKLLGYSFSQLNKMSSKCPQPGSKRQDLRDRYGFDVKYGSHVVRLILECEQILTEGDLDLRRNSEILKSIRRGEWTEQKIRDWFAAKEPFMEKLYQESNAVPYAPDEAKIKQLLLNCLEHHYGSLANCYEEPDAIKQAMRQIAEIANKFGK